MNKYLIFLISILFLTGSISCINVPWVTLCNAQNGNTPLHDFSMDMTISSASEASFIGEGAKDWSGYSVCGVGDVNGDGFDDILIGAYLYDDVEENVGKTYLILGKKSGWNQDFDLSQADASFIGEDKNDFSCNCLAGVRDVNNDGYDDFLISAKKSDDYRTDNGKTYLFFGKPTDWRLDTDLSASDASFVGAESGDESGYSIAGCGDVNGDGFDDFIIGAPKNEYESGQTYIFFGKSTGWRNNIDIWESNASFMGENFYDLSGSSVAGAGDVNGDGFDDILIEALSNDAGKDEAGQTYLILGKASGWTMVTDLSLSDASFIGEKSGDQSGSSVTGAGDVNGDGFDDILIGALSNDAGGDEAGQTYLIFGKTSGWKIDTDLSLSGASFIGEKSGDQSGSSVAGVGDVNEDGLDDIIIGSNNNDAGGINAGQTYLILGKTSGWRMDTDLSNADASFIGEDAFDYSGHSVSGAGDVNGDGSFDIIIGAYRNSEGDNTAGQTYLIFGYDITEPIEVFSLQIYSDVFYTQTISTADILDNIYIELFGLDGNTSQKDFTYIDIIFSIGIPQFHRIYLTETDVSTGVYRGNYTIPSRTSYFETLTIISKKDPLKYSTIYIDKPFRPSSIKSIELFNDPLYSIKSELFDYNDTVYIELVGVDSNHESRNYAFVNISCDENSKFQKLLLLEETGENTGIYHGIFLITEEFNYFNNITFYSVKTKVIFDSLMVHVPIQIRPFNDVKTIFEDEEYRVSYWNFGYEEGTWEMETDATWLNWDENSSEMYGIPKNNHVGTWDVHLVLSSASGNTDMHEFQITVENQPPKITTENILETRELGLYYVDYNCDDDGQGEINWSIETFSTWLSIDPETGILSGIPKNSDIRKHNITVFVEDGNGGNDSTTFDIEVKKYNWPPEIVTTDINFGTQGEQYYRDYDAVDKNGDQFEWSMKTDASFLSIDGYTGEVRGIPGPYDIGKWLVNITASDTGNKSSSHEFELIIENINDKPDWLEIPVDIEIIHGSFYFFDINATDPDPGDVVHYSIRSNPDSDIVIDQDTGIIEWKASVLWFDDENRKLEVIVEVSDGNLFRNHKFYIAVLPTESPSVSLIEPKDGQRTVSKETTLQWEGSDPENETIIYDIYIHEMEILVIGMRGEALYKERYEGTNITISDLNPGKIYYWMVLPNDGCSFGNCTSGVRSFRVNYKPIFSNIQDYKAFAGVDFKIKISCIDQDSEDLPNFKYSLLEAPAGMRINEETGMIRWTPKENQVMLHTVTVKVSDGIETNSATFEIDVKEGESFTSTMVLTVIIVVVVMILLVIGIFFFMKKKKQMDEEALKHGEEERAALEKEREEEYSSYEEIYGVPAPVEEEEDEEITTEKLKEFIHEEIEQLQQMKTEE